MNFVRYKQTLKHWFCDCPSAKDTLAAEYNFLSARNFTQNSDIINLHFQNLLNFIKHQYCIEIEIAKANKN